MDDRRAVGFPSVGAASLLVIFSVLCLTVFALLSISTVQADQALHSRSAQAIEGYYRADCDAERTLALLRAGERPDGVEEENGLFRYTHPISDTQVLAVEVRVEGTNYEMIRWQAIPTQQWQSSDELPVWNGETEEES